MLDFKMLHSLFTNVLSFGLIKLHMMKTKNLKLFEKITHILDPINIDFTLNSTFETYLLIGCFTLSNWRKDKPKSTVKISLLEKFNLTTFIT